MQPRVDIIALAETATASEVDTLNESLHAVDAIPLLSVPNHTMAYYSVILFTS